MPVRVAAASPDMIASAIARIYGNELTVEVEDETSGRRRTYTQVSSHEAAPAEGRLSRIAAKSRHAWPTRAHR